MPDSNDTSPVKPGPHRVQLRRTKGWRKPDNTVVVARPTKWGNPFHVAAKADTCGMWSVYFQRPPDADRYWCDEFDSHSEAVAAAVEFYREWATEGTDHYLRVLVYAEALRGKNLACWCPLDSPCHADVLLELANREVL